MPDANVVAAAGLEQDDVDLDNYAMPDADVIAAAGQEQGGVDLDDYVMPDADVIAAPRQAIPNMTYARPLILTEDLYTEL